MKPFFGRRTLVEYARLGVSVTFLLCVSLGFNASAAEAEEDPFQVKFFDITEGQLAFTYAHDEDRDIYVLDFSTLEVRPLITTPEKEENAEFSPDGKRIAYTAEVKGVSQVFIAEASGANPEKLTSGVGPSEFPSWSPDGKQLVFQSTRPGGIEIVLLTLEGGKQQTLLKNGHRNIMPRISPRGNEMLYASNEEWPGWDVFLLDLGTKRTNILTKGTGSFLSPSWHPYGQGFAFVQSEGKETGLWYAERGTEIASRLNPLAQGKYVDPCWSGKADQLFVAHERTAGKGDYQIEVAKLKPNTGKIEIADDFVPVFQTPAATRHPSFTPFPSLAAIIKKMQRKRGQPLDGPVSENTTSPTSPENGTAPAISPPVVPSSSSSATGSGRSPGEVPAGSSNP